MRDLTAEDHEKLWRICATLLSSGGRAAMLCDATTGRVLVSAGEAGGDGQVRGVRAIAPGERVVHGDAGHVYGVDLPGGLLLAVLHDAGTLEPVRLAAAQAAREVRAWLASPPLPAPEEKPTPRKPAAKRKRAAAKKSRAARKKKRR